MNITRNAGMLILALIAGCAATPSMVPSPKFAPVVPVAPAQSRSVTGSLFVDGRGDNFFGQKRDYRVGDVITVVLDEVTQASRNQNTYIKREVPSNDAFNSIKTGVANALTSSGLPIAAKMGTGVGMMTAEGKVINDNTGSQGQGATLKGSIAVSVVEVMSNGNLVVRGEKQLAFSEGAEVIQVSGVVRNEDIAPNGTVQSRRLANAQFSYQGSGDLASGVQIGWGSRTLYKFWPF